MIGAVFSLSRDMVWILTSTIRRVCSISTDLEQLAQELAAVKMYQLNKKRQLYDRSVRNAEDAVTLKFEVRVCSGKLVFNCRLG